MLILKTIKDLQKQLLSPKKGGKKIGFVPTMGALHAGHLSLIKKAKKETDVVVCSIFVNPTQFNNATDFEKYPITIEQDIELLVKIKCDILFLPSVTEMYPKGYLLARKRQFGFIAETLEGTFRPGHFDGMAQIVEKLLRAVQPDLLYMGQKDYQQAMICGQLIRQCQMKTKLVVCPIMREPDGLAMSSRNMRLSKNARAMANEIYATLLWTKRELKKLARKKHHSRDIAALEIAARDVLASNKFFQVEYMALRDAKTLQPLKTIGRKNIVLLTAAWLDGVRLIDNILITTT